MIYKAEALTRRKQTYRNQLAVIILTVLAGVIGAIIIFRLWGRWFPAHPSPQRWPSYPPPYTALPRSSRTKPRRRWPFFWRTAAPSSLLTRSNAYPCWGFSPSAGQYFTSTNTTISPPISGVIHGYTSSCYQVTYVCGSTCTKTGSSSSGGGTNTIFRPDFCYRDEEDEKPVFFVNYTTKRVQDCGFRLVEAEEVESEVGMRVAHPLIERNWRVSIKVDRLDGTGGTEDAVWCLWDIGNH